tara:strand:- start:77 stop:679 length:603 start_codon:yes stop_codon:yes gene_type:complete
MIGLKGISVFINNRSILENINIILDKYKLTIINGHNGAGKSTLLRVMAGIQKSNQGDIVYDEDNLLDRSSFVFQKPIFLNRSVKDNLLYISKLSKNSVTEQNIYNKLKSLELEYLWDMPAKKVSGGEQQIIAFIRSTINKPNIIFLDEPISNLDIKYKDIIISEISKLSENTKIVITSQTNEINDKLLGEVFMLNNGKIL